jgi:hypothetical protein
MTFPHHSDHMGTELHRFPGQKDRGRGLWVNATAVSGLTALVKVAGALKAVAIARFSVAGIALSTTFAQTAMFILLLVAVSRILRSQETLTC